MRSWRRSKAPTSEPMRPTGWTDAAARGLLRRMFDAAVASADPGAAVLRHLPEKPKGRCVVIGAGKAAVAMAAALDAAWRDVDLGGVVVTRHGQRAPAGRIEVLEASHPMPDAMSEQAGRKILAAVQGLTADDLVVALMSGGGSSLMVLPADGMTLGRQARRQQKPAFERRQHRRDERGAKASLGHQGRAAGAGRVSGTGGDARNQRHPRR